MSIDTRAALVVGLPRKEVDSDIIENDELEVFAPYYDGRGDDQAIAGFRILVSGGYATEYSPDPEEIESLKKEFKEITGLDGKLYLTPDIF